ncbi:hypothetical protein OIV83_003704 [Microbotryomycetes sp. JL201]|nr:hypothetical protein OIV83_003704 [Microbotryomycetes sp. JL201]
MAAAVRATAPARADPGTSRHHVGAADRSSVRPIDPPPLLRLRVKKARSDPSTFAAAATATRLAPTTKTATTLGKRARTAQVAGSVSSGSASSMSSSSTSRPHSTEPASNARAPPAFDDAARPAADDGEVDDDTECSGDDSEYTSPKATHNLFCFASLVGEFDDTELYMLGKSRSRYVTGSVVSSLFQLKDQSCFVFPDLSIRTEGRWRFKMSLYEIQEDGVKFCTSVFTDTFQVYSSKRFPGMGKSTELSKSMAQQGLRLRIRRPGAGSREDEDDRGHEADDLAEPREDGAPPRKRALSGEDAPYLSTGRLLSAAQNLNDASRDGRPPPRSPMLSSPYQTSAPSESLTAVSPEPRYLDVTAGASRAFTYPQSASQHHHNHAVQRNPDVHSRRPQTSPVYGSPFNHSTATLYGLGPVPPTWHHNAHSQPSYMTEHSPRLVYRPQDSPYADGIEHGGNDRRVDYVYGSAVSSVSVPVQMHHMLPSAPLRHGSRSPEQDAAEALAEIRASSHMSSDGGVDDSDIQAIKDAARDDKASTTTRKDVTVGQDVPEGGARKNSAGRGSLADLLGEGTPTVKQDQDVFFFD